jgi:hypothetical protein
MDMESVARVNRILMTQAEMLKALIVRWRTLNPETEDRSIDTIKRSCESVLTSGHVMKVFIAHRRRELNANEMPTPEDAELLAQWDRSRAFLEQKR